MKKIVCLLLTGLFLVSYNLAGFTAGAPPLQENPSQYHQTRETHLIAKVNPENNNDKKEETIKIEVERKKLIWLTAGIIIGVIIVGALSSSMTYTPLGPHHH